MAIKIGHASLDENRKISGGTSGDQTGKEVCIRTWYSKPWGYVLRAKDSAVAEKMAKACEDGCANNNIGYDQNQRMTLYTQAKKVGYDLSKITVACECDCSAFMCVCALAAGINVSPSLTTRSLKAGFLNTGEFAVLTESKYLTSDTYLKRGDILVKSGSHTVMALENGSKCNSSSVTTAINKLASAKSYNKAKARTYTTTAALNLRYGPDKDKYNSIKILAKDSKVKCYGYYTDDWYYVVDSTGTVGFVHHDYLK